MDRLTYFFGCLATWRGHPGYKGRGLEPPSLITCLEQANEMVKLIEEYEKWQAGQQQEQQSHQSPET